MLRDCLFTTDGLGVRLDLPYLTIWKLPPENILLVRINYGGKKSKDVSIERERKNEEVYGSAGNQCCNVPLSSRRLIDDLMDPPRQFRLEVSWIEVCSGLGQTSIRHDPYRWVQ